MTTKRKRKYSEDFSAEKCGRITDSIFAAACDVNNIVKHYADANIIMGSPDDPLANRVQTGDQGTASSISFEDAMRHKAALDSYMAENPLTDALIEPPEAAESPSAKPAPQDSTDDKSVE